MKPYELLTQVLQRIEDELHGALSIPALAETFSISAVHLQRLFKFAFGMPLAGYIRARRLSASVESLLKTQLSVIDIAYEYGFDYEQTYIRAFKQKFGVTPGELRKTGKIVSITPPLRLFDANRLADGVLFRPQIVMVPRFCVVGKRSLVPFKDSVELPPQRAKAFWSSERGRIQNAVEPQVYIGLTRGILGDAGSTYYQPSVRVRALKNVPQGLTGDVFPASLCARFCYVGAHPYGDINAEVARGMYEAVLRFAADQGAKYESHHKELYFERIDTAQCDAEYCQMEWFTPITEKGAADDRNCSFQA